MPLTKSECWSLPESILVVIVLVVVCQRSSPNKHSEVDPMLGERVACAGSYRCFRQMVRSAVLVSCGVWGKTKDEVNSCR